MTTYVAVLYSIVLGPGRRLVMADLRALAEELGLSDPRTLLATGNLQFEARKQAVGTLERKLERGFAERFGRHVAIVVRTGEDWLRLAAGNPFPEEAARAGDRVVVRIMREPLPDAAVPALRGLCTQGERVAVVDGDVWAWFPAGIPQSKLVRALTPARQGIGTLRNANTVNRVAARLG